MSRNWFLVVTLSLLSVSTALLPTPVRAETLLTFADIQALLRQVRLLPRDQPPHPAQVNDRMFTGDALSTARSSKADLRFNDGSFARVGELALFRFIPNTRQFNLSNGTALLLIPPGRGTTTVKTPNVSAGIRGSALFVRVDEQTGTTIVGALTNSGITVTDNVTNRLVELKAGQMAVADPRGLRLFDFDLTTFYQTSNMARGLSLDQKPSETSLDKDIAAVQRETSEAVGKQEKIPEEAIARNLDFIKLSPQSSVFPEEKTATPLPPNPPIAGTTAPEIFDRGSLGTGQPTSSNPDTPKLEQSLIPPAPPTSRTAPPPVTIIPAPTPQPVPSPLPITPAPTPAPTTPPPGGLTPIQKDPAAVKASDPIPTVIPVVTPAPVTAPVQVTPVTTPVVVTPVVTPAPVTYPVQVTPVVTPVVVTPVQVTPVVTPVVVTPVQVTPVATPVVATPPIQVVTPVQASPTPVVAPVISQPLQVVPTTPAAVTSVPSPTPNSVPTVPANNPPSSTVAPTPTLAPSLAPTTAPVLPVEVKSPPVQTPSTASGT